MAELPRPSDRHAEAVAARHAETVAAILGIEFGGTACVLVTPGNEHIRPGCWLISVQSPGKQQLVAECPYKSYAMAVGQALATALNAAMVVLDA